MRVFGWAVICLLSLVCVGLFLLTAALESLPLCTACSPVPRKCEDGSNVRTIIIDPKLQEVTGDNERIRKPGRNSVHRIDGEQSEP